MCECFKKHPKGGSMHEDSDLHNRNTKIASALRVCGSFSITCVFPRLFNPRIIKRPQTHHICSIPYIFLTPSSIWPRLIVQPPASTAHANVCLKVDHRSTRDDTRVVLFLQSQSKSVGRRDQHGPWDSDGWFEQGVITTTAERGAGLPDFQALQHTIGIDINCAEGNQEQWGGLIQVYKESAGFLKTASALDWFIDRGSGQLTKGTDVSPVWNHCMNSAVLLMLLKRISRQNAT